jgi:hypothetical protein
VFAATAHLPLERRAAARLNCPRADCMSEAAAAFSVALPLRVSLVRCLTAAKSLLAACGGELVVVYDLELGRVDVPAHAFDVGALGCPVREGGRGSFLMVQHQGPLL